VLHVWGRGQVSCRALVGRLAEKDHLEDLGLDGSIILKLVFKK